MDLLLTLGEIETLTGRKRTKEQCAALDAMGCAGRSTLAAR
ncbi:DUF4224 domain-containing protein [Vreelandella titanicae]|nr:DUF4224 domain-containing protein [Halomonas titanicae]QNU61363.1 DUF4224 domain-containing protein [Halomonas titanicae]